MARKIIIDTDPGVDDILAILLAFSALPEELQVLLISATYGNIDIQNCLRNVVSLFYHVEKEIEWRKAQGLKTGFETLTKGPKPVVALGPEHPLEDEMLMADFFHGRDGLGGIHQSHPHLTPAETWKALFSKAESSKDPKQAELTEELQKTNAYFTPSQEPGHKEILRLLRENDPDTITIVAIGPLTNLALAAAEDPTTFLRVKEVVVMGGNIDLHGNVSLAKAASTKAIREPPFRLIKQAPGLLRDSLNRRNQITPVAEFNTFADTTAAARLYALSSPRPETTMPPTPPAPPGSKEGSHPPPHLAPYPRDLPRRLKVTLFPLDITERHLLTRGEFRQTIAAHLSAGSPLADWVNAFMSSTFHKVESLHPETAGDQVALQLHDPLCVWYCMADTAAGWEVNVDEDIRVETSGQWTRGMCVVDRRSRRKRDDDGEGGEVAGDHGNWLHAKSGNRLQRCVGSPGEKVFGAFLLQRLFRS